MPVIGFLGVRTPEFDASMLAEFRRGLNEKGYAEGMNVAIEFRWAAGQFDRLSGLAEDLVRRHVAIIVTTGGTAAARAAKAATAAIPIVFVIGEDPVQFGLVASLSRPEGNITGVTNFYGELAAKQLGLLRELVPNPTLIAVLVNPNEVASDAERCGYINRMHSMLRRSRRTHIRGRFRISSLYIRLMISPMGTRGRDRSCPLVKFLSAVTPCVTPWQIC